MIVFGLGTIYIFFQSVNQGLPKDQVAIIEILMIIVLAILAQTVVLIRVYENTLPKK